jgi:hypothetical protein
MKNAMGSKKMIQNTELQIDKIPSPDSDYESIAKFALTFDGYELPNCADLANARSAKSLTELRTVLFFEQRRYRHFGSHPTGEDLEYIRSLVQAIQAKVKDGELE